MSILDRLNPMQRKAAQVVEGPILVLAGAGSGKTRVLTHRITYLVGEVGVRPWNILAVTFTNKAAREMRGRVERLVGQTSRDMWIGTFHALSARILRMEAEWFGHSRNFAIYDVEDQKTVVKRAMADMEVSEQRVHPARVRTAISWAKNRLIGPSEYAEMAETYFEREVAQIYPAYQEELRRNEAFDFDDLIVELVRLFQKYPEVLERYQHRFQHILVDEYQDTNRPQYMLTKLLATKHRNLCVVGDDDQSIYGWRGADLNNILGFERDYPDTQVIRLEQNYRSTKRILDVGNAVIRHNVGRKGKELWTDQAQGEKVVVGEYGDERDEARGIVQTIQAMGPARIRPFRDFALLYRTNAQSRALEDALRRSGVPYVIVGGLRFYERKEIKDVLAYLRVLANPRDGIGLRRIINLPKRGIGEASLDKMEDFAIRQGMDLFEAIRKVEVIDGISGAIKKRIVGFRSLMERLMERSQDLPIVRLAEEGLLETGDLEELRREGTLEAETREENVRELLSAMEEFSERVEGPTLETFLEEVTLITEIDTWDDQTDAVTLMTLHSAKGLEFPVVFITGLEDGLFPLSRAIERHEELEEERRLFYVGITRAQEQVFMSYARSRRRYGAPSAGMGSRFLDELPKEDVDLRSFHGAYYGHRQDQIVCEDIPQEASEGFSQETDASWLHVGRWVIHPSWGRGKIEAREGIGERMKLTVAFENGATKRLMVKYARLEPG